MAVRIEYSSLRQAWSNLAVALIDVGDGAAFLREDPDGLGEPTVVSAYDAIASTVASAIVAFGLTIEAYLDHLGSIESAWRRIDDRAAVIAGGR